MKGIVIAERDREILSRLLEAVPATDEDQSRLEDLARELDRADVMPEVDPEVVTLDSRVRLKDLDSGEVVTYTLVLPSKANIAEGRLSVLAPIGTAILGYRSGDGVRWKVPAGHRRIRIEEVLQPAGRSL
jgi:regulator of nucleoside diphosphate kinase